MGELTSEDSKLRRQQDRLGCIGRVGVLVFTVLVVLPSTVRLVGMLLCCWFTYWGLRT